MAIRVTIERSDAAARREFSVAADGVHVVLDLLARAAAEDPTLCYRYSCRSGFCGTCTVVIDGRPGLACQTAVADGRPTHVAPLGGFPVVRDLVVDPQPLVGRMAEATGGTIRSEVATTVDDDGPPRPIDPARATLADDSTDCIACGACFAACDMSAHDRPFLGPAALTRTMVVLADPATPDRARRLARVSGTDGIDGCRGIGACSVVCPKGLDPARAIRRLRRWRLVGLP